KPLPRGSTVRSAQKGENQPLEFLDTSKNRAGGGSQKNNWDQSASAAASQFHYLFRAEKSAESGVLSKSMRSIRLRIRGRPEQIKGPPVRDVAESRREPFVEFDVFFLLMSLLPRKGLLAIAAVVDVALQTDGRPISAKTLTTRHGLPRRHLESVLQSLV